MIPAAFDYEVAESVEHAVELLGSREDAKLLAGGHSLMPLLKLRVARPVAARRHRPAHRAVATSATTATALAIGALTRHHDLATDPLVRSTARSSRSDGRPDRRPAGPSPRHDRRLGRPRRSRPPTCPTVLLALDAEMLVVGPGPSGSFRRPTSSRASSTGGRAGGDADRDPGAEARRRGHGRISSSAGARRTGRRSAWPSVTRNGGGAIALTNMGPTPLARDAAEAVLADGAVAAGEAAAEGTSPVDDVAASAEFRKHLARVLTRRAVEQALAG